MINTGTKVAASLQTVEWWKCVGGVGMGDNVATNETKKESKGNF